ncbi:MAG TPA: hypothetical protein VFP72_09720 [Kineosporiaceae bacterium]|nr:hypothetical protein [Kineosporiaceae bacterium]
MCSAATCRTCGKTTWRGCGQHVQQVMAAVPKNERCTCSPADRKTGGGFLARLFGR